MANSPHPIVVDVVCDGGRTWVKVITKNSKALLANVNGNNTYDCDVNGNRLLPLLIVLMTMVKIRHLVYRLQLNQSKFEAMTLGTLYRSLRRLSVASVHPANTSIELSSSVKLLGFILDSDLCLDRHLSATVRACNYRPWAVSIASTASASGC